MREHAPSLPLSPMRPRRVPAAPLSAMLALGIVLGLAGCIPSPPAVTPAPEPSVAPIFASDEEALAAAEEAYGRYLEVVDTVLSGDVAPDEAETLLATVLTKVQLSEHIEALTSMQARNERATGTSTSDSAVLQQYDRRSDGEGIIGIYICEDISGVDVVDSEGASTVRAGRVDRIRFEVSFDYNQNDGLLRIAEREIWRSSEC